MKVLQPIRFAILFGFVAWPSLVTPAQPSGSPEKGKSSGTAHTGQQICPVGELWEGCSGAKDEDGREKPEEIRSRPIQDDSWKCVSVHVKLMKVLSGFRNDQEDACELACTNEAHKLPFQFGMMEGPAGRCLAIPTVACLLPGARLKSHAHHNRPIPEKYLTTDFIYQACTMAFGRGSSTSNLLDNTFISGIKSNYRNPGQVLIGVAWKSVRSFCQSKIQGKHRAKIIAIDEDKVKLLHPCYCFASMFYPAVFSIEQTGWRQPGDTAAQDPNAVYNSFLGRIILLDICRYDNFVNSHSVDGWQLYGTFPSDGRWEADWQNRPRRCSDIPKQCPSMDADAVYSNPDLEFQFPPVTMTPGTAERGFGGGNYN